MQVLLQRVCIPQYDENLWYNQILHIFVTQGRTTLGKQMTDLMVNAIPANTPLSPRLQEQIKLMY
jgi:hypothetical protein